MYHCSTIAAVSTASGAAAISIVRMSGSNSINIAKKIFVPASDFETHKLYYGHMVEPEHRRIVDEVMIVAMRSPKSYTGEDMIEIYCHGGQIVTAAVLSLILDNGANAADPGEFTKRAYLNGKIDLVQAEAVNSIINAKTNASLEIAQRQLRGNVSETFNGIRSSIISMLAQIEVAIDHPDDGYFLNYDNLYKQAEDIHAILQRFYDSYDIADKLQNGFRIAIIGKTNSGKSTLFNRLVGEERAIVTDLPGTTRDTIDSTVTINQKSVKLTDTAGIRKIGDKIELIGIEKSWKEIESSDLVLWLIDRTIFADDDDVLIKNRLDDFRGKAILVRNKLDLGICKRDNHETHGLPVCEISAKTGEGVEKLKNMIGERLQLDSNLDNLNVITTVRQKQQAGRASKGMKELVKHIKEGYGEEMLSADLSSIITYLDEFIGRISSDEVLDTMFKQFCVGK